MYAPNPLRSLFNVFGRIPDSHVDGVNRGAFEQLIELLDVDPALRGRCILLRAPRAGYGKTHLLSLAARHFGARHEFVLLTLADGSRMHPGSVLEDLLRQLCRPLPAGGGLTELDLVARRVLAMGLEPLVRSGEVPCQDRESALVALRDRATETFDFHHPNAVTAHWARDNFAVLGPRLGLELSQRVGAPLRESIGWVEAFYRFAATPVDQPARIGALIEAAGGGASIDRLGAMLQMLTALRRVVLVADEIEGLSSDPESALRLAAFITSLRQTAEAVDVIVALNRDLWESAFRPRLSGGLEDRLAEWVIELGPLSEEEMHSLLESRVPGHGAELAAKIDLDGEDRYARNVLRRGAELWEQMIGKNPPPQILPPVFESAAVQEAPEPAAEELPDAHAPSPFLTPADIETAPADIETAPTDIEAAPTDIEAAPTDIEAALADVEAVPVDVEAALAEVEAVPADLEAVPADLEAAPADVEAALADVEAAPADVEAALAEPESWPGGDAAGFFDETEEKVEAEELEDLDQAGGEAPDSDVRPLGAANIPERRAPEPRVIEQSPFMAVEEVWQDIGEQDVEETSELPGKSEDDQPTRAEERISDQEPVEETPKEETPKEETPKEETPREETPREETPKEEASEPAIPDAPPPPPPLAASEDGSDSDRVDELLRQFRERYGRK